MYVLKFEDLNKSDIGIAGGKGANLGELTQAGIPVPPGFVVTAETYEKFMEDSGINGNVMDILDKIDINDTKELQMASEEIKAIITSTPVPDDMSTLILEAYNQLCQKVGEDDTDVAIRSSATAEDLPEASFAGQQETYLHVSGNDEVMEYVRKCWASLFEARAIFYREENNFEHSKVFIAVVVQKMANADKAGVKLEIKPGDRLLSIDGHDIGDVFDYRFYVNCASMSMVILKENGEEWEFDIEHNYEDIGLDFDLGLMSECKSCTNKCVFCFIDQMPPGMRETLYFKDDDSRLSFLQGNYITLTNMSERNIDRIIKFKQIGRAHV